MKFRVFFAVAFVLLSGLEMVSGQTITGFSPKLGTNGQPGIVISGSGFASGAVVRFNGVQATATVTAANQIQAQVPLTATTGPISVKVGANPVVTSSEDFLVISQAPYITNFPSSAAINTDIVIEGVNFNGASSVKFNGLATTFTMTAFNRITARVPANVTTGPISVTTSKGTGTSSALFYAAPSITSFSPAIGRAGTNVVITGKNFTGAISVKLNNVAVPSFNVNSNTQISFVIPEDAVTGKLSVTAGGNAGQFVTTSNFVVLPAIYSFSPAFGKPGTNVTITGAHFSGSPSVKFNGVNATIVGTPTANQIVATVPASATSGPISVTTTNGTSASVTNFHLPPVIFGMTPGVGASGTVVVMTGNNFTNASEVKFNGVNASFTIVNNQSISTTAPAGASSGPISITTPGGSVTNSQSFYFQPVITSFTPGNGISGNVITVTGENFLHATMVKFNNVNATNFNVINNSQLTVTVPTNATTGKISVVAPAGTGVSAANFIIDVLEVSIELGTNQLATISWPSSATGYILQAATNLASPNWLAVTNSPVLVNGRNTITNQVTNSAVYYRLKK